MRYSIRARPLTLLLPRGLAAFARIVGLGAALALSACGEVAVGSLDEPLGEITGDRPSYQERVALYACDKARADPAATGWSDFAAVPPLLWHDSLAQSGRAHSQDMRDTPCFQHNSCDGTDPFVRIKKYWTGAFSTMGENIAAGVSDGQTAVYNWINEIGAPPGTTGHRENTFNGAFHYVGFGYAPGGKQFQGYWTQDFAGTQPPPAIPPIAVGIHAPEAPSAGGMATFSAIFYDAGKRAPDFVEVVIDGHTTPLTLAGGAAAAGAYEARVPITAGCHRYYFLSSVGGTKAAYPDAGTLGVATPGTTTGCDAFVAGTVSLDPGAGTGPGGNIGGGSGGGGCDVGRGRGATGPWTTLLLLAAIPLARRRRARR